NAATETGAPDAGAQTVRALFRIEAGGIGGIITRHVIKSADEATTHASAVCTWHSQNLHPQR
ncbi:MAG: hypothetical protein LBB08_00680, partial [Rickettsiales bacterium]|nr:hypothetical protein [Rickettsiales bacterium]